MPDLCRNGLVSTALHQQAGKPDKARACVTELLARHPGVTLATMRPTRFHVAAEAARFAAALREAGLPE